VTRDNHNWPRRIFLSAGQPEKLDAQINPTEPPGWPLEGIAVIARPGVLSAGGTAKYARFVVELVLPQPLDHILDHQVEECAAVAVGADKPATLIRMDNAPPAAGRNDDCVFKLGCREANEGGRS